MYAQLFNACGIGDLETVKTLSKKIDIHYKQERALRLAVKNKQIHIVQYLINEHKCNPLVLNGACFQYAAKNNDIEMLELLFSSCKDIPPELLRGMLPYILPYSNIHTINIFVPRIDLDSLTPEKKIELLYLAILSNDIDVFILFLNRLYGTPSHEVTPDFLNPVMSHIIIHGNNDMFRYMCERYPEAIKELCSKNKFLKHIATLGTLEIIRYTHNHLASFDKFANDLSFIGGLVRKNDVETLKFFREECNFDIQKDHALKLVLQYGNITMLDYIVKTFNNFDSQSISSFEKDNIIKYRIKIADLEFLKYMLLNIPFDWNVRSISATCLQKLLDLAKDDKEKEGILKFFLTDERKVIQDLLKKELTRLGQQRKEDLYRNLSI